MVKLNTVTINKKTYPLTATVRATNNGRLNTKNAYIVNSVYNGNTLNAILNPTKGGAVLTALTNANLVKNKVSLGASASTITTVVGLGYFTKGGKITIS
jgi:hypothetical protein|tara:strand:- start:291 stop:587 length:297 start_codon:yes stop_codon:yes gene_type:complete